MKSKIRGVQAFTLIELLIVIAIIAILTVAFVPTLRGGQSQARDAAKKALIADITTVLEKAVNEGTALVGPAAGACISDFATADGAGEFIAKQLGRVPTLSPVITTNGDHLCTGSTFWYRKTSATGYVLAIEMENAKSANVKQGQTEANIRGINSVAGMLAATNDVVGEGHKSGDPAESKYFYMVAKD